MKGLALVPVVGVAVGCVAATSSLNGFEDAAPPTPKQLEAAKPVQQAMNEFTFRLASEILKSGDEANACLSPLSVSVCASTLLNGAKNQSFGDLRRTLSYDKLSMDQINDGSYATISTLLGAKGKPFTIANSAWLKTEHTPRPAYVQTLQHYYNADFYGVKNFDGETVNRINQWTSDKTKGRIDKLFDKLDPEDTSLVLVNALTFDGDWVTPFKTSATSPSPFHVNGAADVADRPTMHGTFDADFYQKDGVKALRLPYKGNEFSMVFILPQANTSAKSYLAGLKPETFQDLLNNLTSQETIIALPKFKVNGSYSLKDSLSALGMASLFEEADLSGITDGRFFVSEVVHKTYLKVDEKGAEAAAATGIVVAPTSARLNPPPPPQFIADRPFAYFIVNNATNTILFLGVCGDPN